ncbi:hypothetical protein DPMN_058873 [Dreissena polymorpha]|uniref:CCHC-type domain-containing protein n=1 Tax=Dreissena polymorpha TaxID=45954 RepID=A0A9D4C2V6_DREPO|nr:hypothetical protein DPMN_058873 [Dreissena polymorpha]
MKMKSSSPFKNDKKKQSRHDERPCKPSIYSQGVEQPLKKQFRRNESSDSDNESAVRVEKRQRGNHSKTYDHFRRRRSQDRVSEEDDDSDSGNEDDNRRSVRKHSRYSHAPSGGRPSQKPKHRNHSSDSSSRSGSRHGVSRRRHRHVQGRHRARSSQSRFYYSSSSESDSLSENEYHSRVHGDPRRQPKNLRYDGRTSWLSFKQKFNSYRKVYKWSDHECRDYLNWCLEGKALDYFTIETHMGESFSFRDIMRKMERRFGSKELPETSRAKFQQATQQPEESLEDWADRVLTLAIPAFRDLPDQFGQREAVSKFCQGCIDSEAGKHACFERPRSIQHAVDLVRHHQYVTQVVDGKKAKQYDQGIAVNAVQSPCDVRLEKLEKAIEQLTCKFEASLASNSARNNEDMTFPQRTFRCFHCNGRGHIKKNCKVHQESLKSTSEGQVAEKSPQKTKLQRAGSEGQAPQPDVARGHLLVPVEVQQDASSGLAAEKEGGKSVSASGVETIAVMVVTAGSSYVNMLVGDRQVRARVDSGADISILSSAVYDQLERKPGKVREINMQLADKNSVLKGFVTQPLYVQLGKQSSREGVCVAPISDEMLLGHDLLRHFKALIDLHSDCLLINGESIPLNTTFRDKPVVAKVIMFKRTVDIGPDPDILSGTPIPRKGHKKSSTAVCPMDVSSSSGDKVEATVGVQECHFSDKKAEGHTESWAVGCLPLVGVEGDQSEDTSPVRSRTTTRRDGVEGDQSEDTSPLRSRTTTRRDSLSQIQKSLESQRQVDKCTRNHTCRVPGCDSVGVKFEKVHAPTVYDRQLADPSGQLAHVFNQMESASQPDSYPWDPGGEPFTQSCRVLAGSFSQHPLLLQQE